MKMVRHKVLVLLKAHRKNKTKLKLPHIGWNEVNFKKNELFNGIENKKDFYFVHSYYFECLNSEDNLASTNYDFEFSSIIRKNNVVGYQFHPEKSLKNGLKLLNNFFEYIMHKVRIAPTLLYKNNLVKGKNFESWRVVGNLYQMIKLYNLREVDELIF